MLSEHKKTILISIVSSVLTVTVILVTAGAVLWERGGLPNAAAALRQANTEPAKTGVPDEESRVVDVVKEASPAVVSIVITKDVPVIERYYQEINPFGNDFFQNFFGNGFNIRVPQERQNGTEKREVGGGSGFFISPDGYLVTNGHVVEDKNAEYTVFTSDGKKYNAEILAKDLTLDVAILKVSGGQSFPYLSFDDSDKLQAGQTVIAIGNALNEFRNSVSVGVVSGISRSITAGDPNGNAEQLEGVIQTDAAINPGNSGGPLLDIAGRVVGVNVAVDQGAENIGFALPGNVVKNAADSVKTYGEIRRPYLGVRYVQVTEALKEKNNLSVDYGALVSRGENPNDLAVVPGSPADKAGIVENDIILEIDGVKLDGNASLAALIRGKQIGQSVKLKILHKGTEKTVEAVLEKAPQD